MWQGGWGRGGNNKVRWVIWIVSFVGYKVTMDMSFGASVREPAERVNRRGRTHPERGWHHSIGRGPRMNEEEAAGLLPFIPLLPDCRWNTTSSFMLLCHDGWSPQTKTTCYNSRLCCHGSEGTNREGRVHPSSSLTCSLMFLCCF